MKLNYNFLGKLLVKTTLVSAWFVIGINTGMNAQIQKGQDIGGEAAGDYSGYSVSMPDANTVAIGARLNDANGADAGQVRIYSWTGTAWVQKGIDIDGEAAGDWSGYTVSMPDANTVAIGAHGNDGNGSNAGHVRIYSWNGTAWVQKGIDIEGEAAGDWSGVSVSIPDANTVAIGAHGNDGNSTEAGQVRIYSWNGTAWAQKGLDIDGEAAVDYSGISVSMPDANTVAVGAPYNDGNGANAGQVRIYLWNGTAWVQKGTDIDGEAAGDQLGISVSMPDANTVAIGANANDGIGTDAGHVRIYSWNGSVWTQLGADIDGEAAVDNFGFFVSMPDANTIAIGAPYNDGNGSDAGQVRVYSFCSNTTGTDTQTACNSYTWIDGNTYTTDNNTATDTLINAASCDSVVTLNLTINTVDTSVTANNPMLTANASVATYQWVDCDSGFAAISGETSQSFTATTNGNYAVLVTESGCTDTSACYSIITIGIQESSLSKLAVYPNPTNGQLTVVLRQVFDKVTVSVKNALGEEVSNRQMNAIDQFIHTIDGPAGVYFVTVTSGSNILVRIKVLKQ